METAALTQQEVQDIALVGSVLALVLVLVFIAFYLISAIGYWKMFKKAGKPGWKAFVPFVNDYTRFEMSWNVKHYWVWLISSVLSLLLFYFADVIAGGTSLDFLPDAIATGLGALATYYVVKMYIFLANAFEKSQKWGFCLWLLPFITSLIVGFGKSRYIGNQSGEN